MAEFDPSQYELRDIKLEDIDFGDRHRKEMGNIGGLAEDISEQGVISPIAVIDKSALEGEITTHSDLNPDKPFLLAAGERRTRASIKAGLEEIPAKIFTHEVDEWQMRIFELHENVYREAMTPYEEANAEKQLHKLYQDRYGKSIPGSSDGHSQEDTAKMLGVDRTTITKDLEIAEWGEEFEEVRNADTKREAVAFIKQKKKELAAAEKEQRIKEKQEKQEKTGKVSIEGGDGEVKEYQNDLVDRYIVGSYFDRIEDLPNRSIDVLELDPDWGIDFIKRRASRNNIQKDAPYRSIAPEAYEETLREILKAAWPKLKDHSWVLCWYSIEEWHDVTRQVLIDVGFTCGKMPAFWIKSAGNTATPAFRLGDTVAAFYYARKGTPRIQNMGRNNSFQYRTLNQKERSHPAEKPVELYQDIFNTFGKKGQVMVSGFAGSGNALLAAENLQMNSIGYDTEEENKDKFRVKVFDEEPGSYSSYN